MRHSKKILAFTLAGSMVLSMLCIPSLAEDSAGSLLLPGAEIVTAVDSETLPEELSPEIGLPGDM